MLKNEKGFTLIEMLIVLMIISVLIILLVPNLANKSKEVNDKGCNALESVVQSQADAYTLDHNRKPSQQDLVNKNYIDKKQTTCKNGEKLMIKDGVVTREKKSED